MKQRKASGPKPDLWLDHSLTDQARRVLGMKRDQVQIAEAHLLCCADDHDQLQDQLTALKSQIVTAATKRKKVNTLNPQPWTDLSSLLDSWHAIGQTSCCCAIPGKICVAAMYVVRSGPFAHSWRQHLPDC